MVWLEDFAVEVQASPGKEGGRAEAGCVRGALLFCLLAAFALPDKPYLATAGRH